MGGRRKGGIEEDTKRMENWETLVANVKEKEEGKDGERNRRCN